MDPTSLIFWFFVILIAIIPGFLATWLGVGGCFLRIPMLMYLLGLDIKRAYFVNQAVISLTTIPGVIEHYRKKNVFTKGAIVAGLSAALGVSLGAYLVAKYIPAEALKVIFGFACIFIGFYVAYNSVKKKASLTKRLTLEDVGELECGPKLIVLMFLAGFATGICGFGGGIYYLPIFFALGYPTHVAVGTSSAQMILTAGVGASILAFFGYTDLLTFLAVGSLTLIASWFGARFSSKTAPWILRLAYAVSIILVGGYVAFEGLL